MYSYILYILHILYILYFIIYITGLIPFVKLIDNFDAEYEYITNEGSLFTFKSNLRAPRSQIINIDFNKPEPQHWYSLIKEHETDVLDDVMCVNENKLVLIYTHDVKVSGHIINSSLCHNWACEWHSHNFEIP